MGFAVRLDCDQFARRVSIWVGMVFLLVVMLCTWIVGIHMRIKSGVRHLTSVRSALFVELSSRGMSASVCDGIEPDLRLKIYVAVFV